MNELISPRYQMQLVQQVHDKIWEQFKSYKDVLFYIRKWHESDDAYNYNNRWENFAISLDVNGNIDLKSTLHNMKGYTILKIAIDLGIDTPDFVPSIPTFKNAIKEQYENVYDTFIKAVKNIESDPSLSIGLANSAFESLIKEILKDERFSNKLKGGETLYKLMQSIINEFKLNEPHFPPEAKTLCSSLLSISQSIEKLRSEKTIFHGKTKEDLLIDDSIYVYLTINAFTTVGLFLNSYYNRKYPQPKVEINDNEVDDLPF
ncbi:abortive infection family protein [Flavobacterium soli]|uniref:abortive infection family protein n=1 Tax=Flavobacterium soli TaxID=344881 RepID=UPI0003FFC70B|nr:abortive infection family protein [Flavobacterium soli]